MLKKPLDRFRLVAILEGCSYLCFAVTMPLKYGLAMPQPNYIVGMIHGVLFVLYLLLLAQVALINKWSLLKIALAFIAAIIPFGTFYAEKKLYHNSTIE